MVDGHRAYRAVLLALARPGQPQPMRAPDPGVAATRILCSTWAADDPSVVVIDGEVEPAALVGAPRGTDERPEDGATVLVIVEPVAPTTAVRLSGPGVDGTVTTELPLTTAAIEARTKACADWPRGIDVVFVVAGPAAIGLPRTTRVEVV